MATAVLAVQGDFAEHETVLARLHEPYFEIRNKTDLARPFDRLILPGGESTVMGRLLRELELLDPLRRRIQDGLPVFGTCAGLLLLAEKIDNDPRTHFATMPVLAHRNAYGRQLGSFQTTGSFGTRPSIPMVFIRAPYLEWVHNDVTILSTTDQKITAARYRNMLVTAFHPELTDDDTVHQYFLEQMGNH